MKKGIALLLISAMVLSLAACSGGTEDIGETPSVDPSQPQTSQTEPSAEATQETETIDYTNWGVTERYTAEVDGDSQLFSINFPYRRGGTVSGGMMSEQGDGTTVILTGQNSKMPEVDSIAEVFPACFERLEVTFKAIYGIGSKNYVFTLESDEPVQINDYDMHRFLCSVSFELSGGQPKNFQFVAYATTLKSNGGIVYWVVFDNTNEQTNGELIQQHAYNMAHTFREE